MLYLVDGSGDRCNINGSGKLVDGAGSVVRSTNNREFLAASAGNVHVNSQSDVRDVANHQLKDDASSNAKTNASGVLQDGSSGIASTSRGQVSTTSDDWAGDGYYGGNPASATAKGCIWEQIYWRSLPGGPLGTNCDLHTGTALRVLTAAELGQASISARSICRHDPRITLSDGTEFSIEIAGKDEFIGATYDLTLPRGVTVKSFDTMGDDSGRESFTEIDNSRGMIYCQLTINGAEGTGYRVNVSSGTGTQVYAAVSGEPLLITVGAA